MRTLNRSLARSNNSANLDDAAEIDSSRTVDYANWALTDLRNPSADGGDLAAADSYHVQRPYNNMELLRSLRARRLLIPRVTASTYALTPDLPR